MAKTLPDIIYMDDKSATIDSNSSMYQIPMYKSLEYFSNIESYVSFIKNCERLIRNNDKYKKYIYFLKNVVGLKHCQVLSEIEPDEEGNISIEMHHGPIFTLYDYCEIMIEYFLAHNIKISTFRIAEAVLEEHAMNRVQVVMLLATVHEEVHNRNIFINHNQAFGDLHAFVKKYSKYMSDALIEKMNRYIDRSLMQNSHDFDLLKINTILTKGM